MGKEENLERLPQTDYEFESPDDILSLIYIDTTNAEEANEIRAILTEFIDCFAVEVRKDPAISKDFVIVVNDELWEMEGSRAPARLQSFEKQQATAELVIQLEKLGCIVKSQDCPYSHIHVVKKPNGKYRPCIDFWRFKSVH